MSTTRADTETEAVGGIQVELVVGDPGDCPITDVSRRCDSTVDAVARSSSPSGCEVAEFTVSSDADVDGANVTRVFDSGSRVRYRHSYDACGGCLCDYLDRHECPVSDVYARDGTLHVTFYARSMDTVRTIVGDVREEFGDVSVRHLAHSGDLSGGDPVLVDCDRLTDRQQEVLETAFEMGYFDHPKGANATEVAAALDIAPATLTEHLAAGQSKLLTALFEERSTVGR